VWTVSVGGLMEKKANTPSKGRSLSLFFFLERKENRETLRGSEKEAKNIAWNKEFRRGCAGLFFAAAK
jgi:hypothetical protein